MQRAEMWTPIDRIIAMMTVRFRDLAARTRLIGTRSLAATLLISVAGCADFPGPWNAAAWQADSAAIQHYGEGAETIETFKLANGMDVVVIPDRRAPVITHMVWYRVGAADEPPGKSGIAHFLEHLMFKGTETVPSGELSKIVARNGGEDNAFTTADYTAYFQRVASDRLELVMKLEADRMANLTLSAEDVATEREVVREERRSRIDNDPASLLQEDMRAALFGSHPYAIPVIGYDREVSNLSRADALDFYQRYYTPNNAVLIVAGDIDAETLRPLAERYYGTLPARIETPQRRREGEPLKDGPQRIEREDPRVQQPMILRYYLAPSYAMSDQAVALDVMGELLGGGPTSWLNRRLVVERNLAASAGAWYSGTSLNEGTIGVYAIPRPGVAPADLEAALDEELQAFIAQGVTPSALTRAKTVMLASAIYARDSQQEMARIYGASLMIGLSPADVLNWPDRVRAVDADQVLKAAQDYLQAQKSVTGLLLPGSRT